MQTVTYQQHLFRQLSEGIREGAHAHFMAILFVQADPAVSKRFGMVERIAFARVNELQEALLALRAGTLSPLEGVA